MPSNNYKATLDKLNAYIAEHPYTIITGTTETPLGRENGYFYVDADYNNFEIRIVVDTDGSPEDNLAKAFEPVGLKEELENLRDALGPRFED